MSPSDPQAPIRPRDLALVLLASRDLLPRKRARDQQADLIGIEIKRKILQEIAARDPDPGRMDAVLVEIIEGIEPSGPARALAAVVRDEWLTACTTPGWIEHLLSEAIETT